VKSLRPAIVVFISLSVLTGIAYPLVITGVSTAVFADQAAGSLIEREGKTLGSRLIGQNFTTPGYFWGRPSATATTPYNALASGGSNQGPLNPVLLDAVNAHAQVLRDADPHNSAPIPVDLVTASASGLDPHVSIAGANYQVSRVARARNLATDRVRALVAEHTTRPLIGFLGEPVVNVLELNLALDSEVASGHVLR
jgi:K+-transporting ATPase ATPase C chain